MFGKLKDRLKKTLSVFSKKAEEEIVEEPAEEKKEETVEEAAEEKEGEAVEEKKEVKEERDEKVVEEKKEEIKEKPREENAEIKEPEPEKPIEKKDELKKEIKEELKTEEESVPEKKGFFTKAREYVSTKKISAEKFDKLFWELEMALLENNVSVEIIEKIKNDLKEELVDKPLPRNVEKKIEETLKKSLEEVLDIERIDFFDKIKSKKPFVIAFFGINGSGKTTTIAKIAHLLKEKGISSVLAAGDTFRAAAIDQLEEHANKLGMKIIKHDYGADAAAVAFDAVKYADKSGIDAVLIDTAGRLHSDANLMDELKKIVKVVEPDLKIFVGESITGNDCVEQAARFNEHIGIDGLILTKADVDEKGGAALSVSFVTEKPILFIGTGQEYGDLKEFDSELVLNSLGLK